MQDSRIVITGVGLTAPNGNHLAEFRQALRQGRSGVGWHEVRYMPPVPAGVCRFDATRYQTRKDARRGTRAGSISVWCAHEALAHAGLQRADLDLERTGVFVGITEHGNVETEQEVYNISQYGYDVKYWTHHHNPRTVANNPAGEVTLNLGITGPHLCLGAACAAGNIGIIYGAQMLRLGEVDRCLAGGVSESIHTFGIFASFQSQNALARHADPTKASRPFDAERNGIVVSEGGCLFLLERLPDARARGARILGEIAGWAYNSDASDAVLPNPERQARCMELALGRAGLSPREVDIISTHGTATPLGDQHECAAIRQVFQGCGQTWINNTKSMIGHAMGAAGALELAGNLPAFQDGMVHPTINIDRLDPECELRNLVIGREHELGQVEVIMNNSFGMLGINSVVIARRYRD